MVPKGENPSKRIHAHQISRVFQISFHHFRRPQKRTYNNDECADAHPFYASTFGGR
jgi:hypothetical protein